MKRVIMHVVDIAAAPDIVTNAISSIDGLSNWWTKDVSGSTDKNKLIHFRFADVFKPDMEVTENGPSMVQWQCIGGEKDWSGDLFTFSFAENGKFIKLNFRQDYSNDISDEQYGRFNYNWGYYLNSLKLYCETGKGAPFTVKK